MVPLKVIIRCAGSAQFTSHAVTFAAVEAAGFDVLLGERGVGKGAERLGIVNRKPRRLLERLRAQAGVRAKDDPVKRQVHVVIGEPVASAVAPTQRPATADAGVAGRKVIQKIRRAHTRTSTTGTDGASPARNASIEAMIRSVSNRTGTSNSKPAVTAALSAGGCENAHLPGRRVELVLRIAPPSRRR